MSAEITKKTAFRFVLRLFSYAKFLTLLMFFLVLCNTIFMYVVPIFTEKIVDGLLTAGLLSISYGMVIAYAVVLLASVFSENMERFIAIKHSEVTGERFRKNFFRILFQKDYVEFNRNSYGDVETVMTSCVEDVNDSAYCFVETLIVYPIGIILGTTYITGISPWLLLILLAQLILNYLIMHHGSLLRNQVQKENYQAQGAYFSALSAMHHAYENIRLLFLFSDAQKKHDKTSSEFAQANIKMAKVNALHISMLLELSDAVLNIAVIILFFFLIRSGESSIGSYLAFVAMKEAISGSFNGFIKLKANKATFDAALEEIDGIESLEEFLSDAGMTKEEPTAEGMVESTAERSDSLRLSHVAYTYPESRQRFLFDYDFLKNHCYLVVGENGVGKSTLIRLVTGMLTGDTTINTCGAAIKVLPQDIRLFDESIVDIWIGKDTQLTEKIARELGITELMDRIRQNDNDDEEECAINSLSGGEKKKILLSLIMGQSPDVLILDEPFAEVDTNSKEKLAEVIAGSCDGRIVIVITHEVPDALREKATIVRVEKRDGISTIVK